jgi:hypothetical protein
MERNLHETTSRWKTYGKQMENNCFPRTLKFEMKGGMPVSLHFNP